MAAWEDLEPPGLAVWCDKSLVFGGLHALQGEGRSGSALVDAIGLIDAIVWFDRVVVDDTLHVKWPDQVAEAVSYQTLQPDEVSQLRDALEEAWNSTGVHPKCEEFWRHLFADPHFRLNLSNADFMVDSAHNDNEFMRSVSVADLRDALMTDSPDPRNRRNIAAFSTARALSGGLIAAQLGLFHMPSAIRRGLLGSFDAPGQVTDLIAIDPISGDARLPSAFGRVSEIAASRPCNVWEAVATVRHELEPVRRTLQGTLTDPTRIRPRMVRGELGFDRPEVQAGLGLNFAVLSGFFGRTFQSRQVMLVQRLERAAETLSQAADDLCRLTGAEMPVIGTQLSELSQIAQRLAA